jgi:hypothetical protein
MTETISLPLPDGRTAAIKLRVANLGRAWWVHPTAVTIGNEPPQAVVDVTRWVQVGLWLVAGAAVAIFFSKR